MLMTVRSCLLWPVDVSMRASCRGVHFDQRHGRDTAMTVQPVTSAGTVAALVSIVHLMLVKYLSRRYLVSVCAWRSRCLPFTGNAAVACETMHMDLKQSVAKCPIQCRVEERGPVLFWETGVYASWM
jgi:hypothetical protein